jgi:hypothetical protein
MEFVALLPDERIQNNGDIPDRVLEWRKNGFKGGVSSITFGIFFKEIE